ncbi:MAG TPA: efflux RND transporter periplasmic adaptor subunit, partial [Vicinamibacterales bacterium]
MTGKKVLIVLGVVLVGAAVVAANLYYRRDTGLNVQAEALRARDLEAIVSASGKVQPKRQVNVSAQTPGRVTRIAVEEGQRVKAGQFLLEIDPKQLEGQLQRGEASVAAAQSSLLGARTSVEQGRANLELARQNLKRQEDLWKEGLTTKENLEKAQNEVTVREADLRARTQDIETNEQRIKQEQAGLSTTRYNLNQIIITAPMDGLVTRRSIEEGETAVVGTMNNAGSVLLTIADMSVIEAEVEVDETEIPTVALHQEAKVTIDAVPDRTFKGRVTEIGNSPIQTNTNTQSNGQRQATTFKVVITLEEPVPDIRPGFTCTAEITTAKRKDVVAVPI